MCLLTASNLTELLSSSCIRKSTEERLTCLFFFLFPSSVFTSALKINKYQALKLVSGLDGKEYTCNAGDLGSIPGSGSSPGEGNGNLLQYSCLESSMDREACRGFWEGSIGIAESDTTE